MTEDLTSHSSVDVTAHEGDPVADDHVVAAAVPSDATVISSTPPILTAQTAATGRPNEMAQSMLGQQLGDVRLEEYVGGGGMGAVFRGHDIKLHRTVAVKVLSARVGDADSARRFQIEARSAARLDHPNIARVHFVGEERGIRFLVFEYIEGMNLRDLVDEPPGRCRWPTPCATRCKLPTRCSTPGSATSCIATSSRRTSWSRPRDRPSSSTWDWLGCRAPSKPTTS